MKKLIIALLAALTASLTACGVPSEQQARTTAEDDVPFGLLDPQPTVTAVVDEPPPSVVDTFGAYFIRTGSLVELPVTRSAPITPADAVELLIGGPDAGALREGLRTALVGDETVRSVRSGAGTVTVDLGADFTSLAPREQLLGLAQIVLTVTTLRGIGSVTVLVDGKRSDVRVGDGSLKPGPVTRDDYTSLLAR